MFVDSVNIDDGSCKVCKAECGPLVCSNCNKTSYCSFACQSLDWERHNPECYPCKVVKSEELEKPCLIVTREVKQWELILKEEPIMTGPRRVDEVEHKSCLACYKILGEEPNRCSSCEWTVCNEECAKAAIHADFECPIFTKLKDSKICNNLCVPLVFTLRCLLLKDRNPDKWKQIMELDAKVDKLMALSPENLAYFHFTVFIRFQCDMMQFEVDEIYQVIGAISHNGVENIVTVDGQERCNMIMYAMASQRTHYCHPNTCWTIDADFNIQIRASLDIPALHRIRTCIVGNFHNTAIRKAMLKQRFFIDCNCIRCSDPTELGTYMSGIRCSQFKAICKANECNGFVLPSPTHALQWKCNTCRLVITTYQAAKFNDEFEYACGSLMDWGRLAELEFLGKKYENKVHPQHYTMLAVGYQIMWETQKYFENCKFEDPAKYETHKELVLQMIVLCERQLQVLDRIWPGYSRNYGELLYLMQLARTLQIRLGGFDDDPTELFHEIRDIREMRETVIEILDFELDDHFKKMVKECKAPHNVDQL